MTWILYVIVFCSSSNNKTQTSASFRACRRLSEYHYVDLVGNEKVKLWTDYFVNVIIMIMFIVGAITNNL